MSRNGTVITIPPDSPLAAEIALMQADWYLGVYAVHSRAAWLTHVEMVLAQHYPAASSRDRNLTARGLAPFPLAHHP